MGVPSYKILFLEFPDNPITFPLEIGKPCSWKYIMIISIHMWNLFLLKFDVISNRLPWNHLLYVTFYDTRNVVIHILVVFIQILTW